MLLSLRIAVLVGMRLLLAPFAIIRFVVKGFGDLGERERERKERERGPWGRTGFVGFCSFFSFSGSSCRVPVIGHL